MPEIMGRKVGPIGYGLMGLTMPGANVSEEQAFEAMRAALDTGCNMWNGGEFYGTPDYNSLDLLRKYYERYPEDVDKVVLNIKGGFDWAAFKPDGSPEFLKASVERCLEKLGGRGKIDQYECARRDPKVPLAQTLGVLKELVDAGKIGEVALSEVNANTIREAAGITEISGVEVELSLWSTNVLSNGVAKACADLNIPIIAYSPVGRGMLTGQIKSFHDLAENDFRRRLPRFQEENFEINMKLVREVEKLAKKKSCTTAQLALGWVKALSKREGMPEIIPIPGTKVAERVRENAVEISLTSEEMDEIDSILGSFEVQGTRYHAAGMQMVDG